MFGTVIIDAYRKEETRELAEAIDDLCSPNDNYGWASAGIYCFWYYYAEAVLYIGLAGNLAERFRQHNGILPIKEGSKQKKIEEYFSKKREIGIYNFLQNHRCHSHWCIEIKHCMKNSQGSKTLQ